MSADEFDPTDDESTPDDGDARLETGQVVRAIHDERVRDTRLLLDHIEIGALDLGGVHRRLHERRVMHARHAHVDAEDRLAGLDVIVARPD